jgi:hypothetical protein
MQSIENSSRERVVVIQYEHYSTTIDTFVRA